MSTGASSRSRLATKRRTSGRDRPSGHLQDVVDIALSRVLKQSSLSWGAGVTGAFVAEAMSRRYPDVVVVDRRSPGAGSTSAFTALLQWEIDIPLVDLREEISTRNASRTWKRSFRATQDLVRLVERENIRCQLERRNSPYLVGNTAGHIKLVEEARVRKVAGLPCEYIDGTDLKARFGVARTGAIVGTRSAVTNPVALTRGLLRRAQANGARIFPLT